MKDPISIVLLIHNEAEVIEGVVRGFYDKILVKLPGSEIILVEDGSTDGTKEILAKLIAELPGLTLFEGKERRGYVNAFKSAMKLPKNELILFCDSSGKHDPNDFWKLYDAIDGVDMIIGYKIKRADPYYRILISKVFNMLVNGYFHVSFKDIDCPFRLYRKQIFLDLAQEEWFEKALVNFEFTIRAHYRGYKISQMPVTHMKRLNGPSRGLPLGKIPKVIKNVLKVFVVLKQRVQQSDFRKVYS